MAVEIDYRGVIQPVRAIPEAEQRELIAKYEPSEVYVLGGEVTQDTVAKQQRPPRAVVVSDAALLGEQRGSKTARFDSFLWMKAELHKRGGWFEEARTGLRSNRDKDWAILRRTAEKMCARLAQGAKSALNAKRGAKPWDADLQPGDKGTIRAEWYVINGKRTVDDAVKAIKAKLGKRAPGRTVLYREFDAPVIKRK